MAHLQVSGVTVRGRLRAVDLDVPDGTRCVVLGASGSGKSTLLRAVAGVAEVAGGGVHLDGVDVTGAPPRERDVALVDQRGTLQPHLDVRGNLGFRLRLRRTPRGEVRDRVAAEARSFALESLLRRRPRTLSAGERHEVALARTLVQPCAVLLLDEPFARVDAARRAALRTELRQVQAGYGVTTLLATNDPLTAWSLAEQVVVLDRGEVLQAGPVAEVAARPATLQVAQLLVVPPVSVVRATLRGRGPDRHLVAGPVELPVPHLDHPLPATVDLVVRPRDVTFPGPGPARVATTGFLGDHTEVRVERGGQALRVEVPRGEAPRVGERVAVRVAPGTVSAHDPASGRALAHGL